jgi:hypothetical protein
MKRVNRVSGWVGILLALACLTVQGALCEELDLDSGDRYLLLATKRTSTMQKELDQAAAHGYRIVSGSPLRGSEIGIVLELQAEPAEGFQYLLLATNRLSTMEKELNEVGRQGFRVTPEAIFPEGCDCGELIVVTERGSRLQAAYEYRVLGTHRTSTLNREMNQAAAEGFVLAAITRESENVAIMVRELDPE